MTRQWKKSLIAIAALLATGAVLIPVCAYIVGSYVVGPYAGDGGMPGYLGTIFVSAQRGERAALTLILAPILIVATWQLGWWLFQRPKRLPPDAAKPEQQR